MVKKSKKGGSPASKRVSRLVNCKRIKSSKGYKKAGSLSKKIIERIVKLNCVHAKRNPGVFPPVTNVTLKDIFKTKGGKRKRSRTKKQAGGSDWISSVYSYQWQPSKGEHLGFPNLITYFTKTGEQYVQVPINLHKGPMFYPLKLHKK
jgi:hypothetical protein